MKSSPLNYEEIIKREIENIFDIHQAVPEEERLSRSKETIDAFHELFIEISKELKIKDGWPEAFAHIVPFGIGIIERSDKMNGDFTIAVELEGFRMQIPLVDSWAIRHMGNEFWSLLASLARLGKASLNDYGRPTGLNQNSNNDRLIKNNNGLVFSIARDYILWEQSGEPSYSVGSINLELSLETAFADVRAFFKEGLRLGYRANYLLFRQAYLIRKANERRILRSYQQSSPTEISDN